MCVTYHVTTCVTLSLRKYIALSRLLEPAARIAQRSFIFNFSQGVRTGKFRYTMLGGGGSDRVLIKFFPGLVMRVRARNLTKIVLILRVFAEFMSEWHMVWPLWKFSVTGKGKAVLKEPSIPLCANDDCGIVDLLLCKCTNTIFPLVVLTKFIIFYSQYHMACRGELSNLRGVGFVMTSVRKMLAFVLESLESAESPQTQGVYVHK